MQEFQPNKEKIKEFKEKWLNKGDEKSQTQIFWIELLTALGLENPTNFLEFEKRVSLKLVSSAKNTTFIDAYIPHIPLIIEQKSLGIDLTKKAKQSNGEELTPFEQAKRYDDQLALSQKSKFIIVCNFSEFLIYNMDNLNSQPEQIYLKEIDEKINYEFLANILLPSTHTKHYQKQIKISKEAGNLVKKLYENLQKQYIDFNDTAQQHLNELCVRLVFCFYAEDAGLFGAKSAFGDYMRKFENDPASFRKNLIEFFKILNQKPQDRDPYLDDDLAKFPYVNGGLFSSDYIEIPKFTSEVINIILNDCSEQFDWNEINPTIFGAVFESTLNPITRRSGGMHYTSIENIHKVIDNLFLNDLKAEFSEIKSISNLNAKRKKLNEFKQKLASLKFLDPACGSGNFLTQSYICLRKLENEILMELKKDDIESAYLSSEFSPILVNLQQFWGIEINDFAVKVAKAALWIAQAQMQEETKHIVGKDIDFFPLKDYAHIVHANALQVEWSRLDENQQAFDYIFGNPPFIGHHYQTKEQKADILAIFGKKWYNAKSLDLVCAWYKKAFDYLYNINKNAKCAFVSTSSINQGELVAGLWNNLFENGLKIFFAYKSFIWSSESFNEAHVYCCIIGFSLQEIKNKKIFSENEIIKAKNINAYLLDAPNIFIENRTKPLCNVSRMIYGNKPTDDGNFLLEEDEKNELIEKNPIAKKWIRKLLGSYEFINNKNRYCLWLVNALPDELNKAPLVMDRINKVREFRLTSKAESTQKYANRPTEFKQISQPDSDYLLVPRVSSENRKYIPMGFISKEVIVSDRVQIVPNATLYEFGVLTSRLHNIWTSAICGRLGTSFNYSSVIVYNNFPWCQADENQKQKIISCANEILEARKKYENQSLASLYNPLTMPKELLKAHENNDKAVMQAYGFALNLSEEEILNELFKAYKELTKI